MQQAVSLGILSGANLLITIIIQWQVLTVLGPGPETDAFFASVTIPQLLLSIVTGSLVHVLVPLLSGEKQERLNRDAWTVFLVVGIIFGATAVVLHSADNSHPALNGSYLAACVFYSAHELLKKCEQEVAVKNKDVYNHQS